MNSVFLILVAIPLGAYLLVLLMSTRDLGASENAAEDSHAEQEMIPIRTMVEHTTATESAIETPENIPSSLHYATSDILVVPASPEATLAHKQETVTESTISSVPVAQATTLAAQPETTSTPKATLTEITATSQPSASGETQIPAEAKTAESDAAPQTPAKTAESSETRSLDADEDDPILPEGPIQLPSKGSPKYAFDYRGRLWVEKKNKGFFRQLRRPLLPPDDPQNQSDR